MVVGSVLFWALGTMGVGWAAQTSQKPVAFNKLPLYFVENQGQVDAPARFYSVTPGIRTVFSPREITLSFPSGRAGTGSQRFLPSEPGAQRPAPSPPVPPQVVRWRPVDLSQNVKLTGAEQLPGKFNHYKGSNPGRWRAGLPTYGAVVYRQAYPGVDLKFYGAGQELEYDIIVQPGANPSQVRFRLEGIKSLAVTPAGDLAVTLPGGQHFLQKKPLVYQESQGQRVPRDGHFKVYPRGAAWEYGFEVAAYDPNQALVIDPLVTYSTCIGGSGRDYGMKIALDASDQVYVVGTTESGDFVTSTGSTFQGGSDVFVVKMNPVSNVMIFSTLLGGDSTDLGMGIALSADNVFVCGKTYSDDFPPVSPLQESRAGSYDAFVAKLSQTNGALLFSTYLGGTYDDGANAIATGGSSDVAYVVGYTKSFDDFPTVKPLQDYRGNQDIFVAKINAYATPSLEFSTYLGGSGVDNGTAIVAKKYVDEDGMYGSTTVGITGNTSSEDLPIKDGLAYKGGTDAFIIEVYFVDFQDFGDPIPDPHMTYTTYLGGSANDYGTGIAHYLIWYVVTGETNSTDFPKVKSQSTPAGGYDVFLTSIDQSDIFFSTLLGGSGSDYGNALVVDSLYNIYVVGTTYSSDFHLFWPMYRTMRGVTDAFVAKFTISGKLRISTLVGGSGYEFGNGIAIDSANNIFITGETGSADLPKLRQGYSGGGDAFITKLGMQSGMEFIFMLLLDSS
jgi:hypothetical protein